MTLQEKFQKLTGINVIDIEEYINNAEDKNEAFARLQKLIPQGRYTDHTLIRDTESIATKTQLFAEVFSEIAEKCGIDAENVDLNENQVKDSEDKIAEAALSEATAILSGYDSEDDNDDSSSN